MNFIDAVKTCFTKYANFNGRAGLPEYWWFFLFLIVASLIMSSISAMLANIFSLATFVPMIAVTARRLHDTNKTGWLQVGWNLGMIVGIVLVVIGFASMFMHSSGSPSMVMGGIGGLLMLVSFAVAIYFMVQKGDADDNQYGAPPA